MTFQDVVNNEVKLLRKAMATKKWRKAYVKGRTYGMPFKGKFPKLSS